MAILKTTIDSGIVCGLPCSDHEISTFKGIPFAAPPVGHLRWRTPQPVKPWNGEYHAYMQKAIPVQDISGSKYREYGAEIYPFSEDCLYLNVWTPAKSADEKLSVIVWVYGGAFKTGSCTNRIVDGENFARSGCIFVSFNYRMGPLGYMAHPDLTKEDEHHTSGNYGVLDQIEALKWVKRNIHAFGGDAERITLIGQSAGAYGVMSLCNSPLSKGLIQRAIIHSTAGLSAMYYQDEQMTLEEAEQVCSDVLEENGIHSLEEARAMDAMELTRKIVGAKHAKKAVWFPRRDHYVLPHGVVTGIMENQQAKIDYLCGSTSEEGGANPAFHSDDLQKVIHFAQMFFGEDVEGYLNSVQTGTSEEVRKSVFDQYGNDKLCALLGWQELEKKRGGKTFYQYYFTKKQPGADQCGACHSSDLPYILKTLPNNGRPYDASDYKLSMLMHQYWVNFVKTGNPNGNDLPVWSKYGEDEFQLMELGEHVGMIKVPWDANKKFIVDYMLKQAAKSQRE